MKTYPLLAKRSRKKLPIKIGIRFRTSIQLETPEQILQRMAGSGTGSAAQKNTTERDDHRLRVGDTEANEVARLLDISTEIFSGEDEGGDSMAWRRLLHFLLESKDLPIAETAGNHLVRPNAGCRNKHGRINFSSAPDQTTGAVRETAALHATNVTRDSAEIEFEFGYEGPELETLLHGVGMLSSLFLACRSGNQELTLTIDNEPFSLTARKAVHKLLAIIDVDAVEQ